MATFDRCNALRLLASYLSQIQRGLVQNQAESKDHILGWRKLIQATCLFVKQGSGRDDGISSITSPTPPDMRFAGFSGCAGAAGNIYADVCASSFLILSLNAKTDRYRNSSNNRVGIAANQLGRV